MENFGVLSLLPPLVAIILALYWRRVIPSLFLGIWVAATMINGFNPFMGFYKAFEEFIIPSLGSKWNATIIMYGAAFGGLIAILQKTGGAHAVAEAITKRVKSSTGAQIATWLFGIVIFFDDYFNALTVGNVMRPICDKVRISREKLAYIVDSTSAPICLLIPVSTWIVYVMGLIGTEFQKLGITESPYLAYLKTIPYNLYSILALVMVAIIAVTKVEFGPMAQAELRARKTGKVLADDANPPSSKEITEARPKEGIIPRVSNMVIPLAVLLIMIPPLFLWTGGYKWGGSIVEAVGNADGAMSTLIAVLIASLVGIILGIRQKIFDFNEGLDTFIEGVKGMVLAFLILILAWSIGDATRAVGTADFIVQIAKGVLSPSLIPVVTFVAGCIISFSTGTSYGTFAIMMPIAVPIASSMGVPIFPVIAAVLSGGIFGDHCSPISDTTILSSTGASCDHVAHVRTQLPYAITTGLSALVGFLVIGYVKSALVSLVVSVILLYLLVRVFSKIWSVEESIEDVFVA
ncbi:sodium:proton antiporter [Anoxybacter fermentans]|uniref:Sodium:proton antiporter n=2 Tax=Bacteria TaxID=2 RepID=A0A3Q9HT53_9FIRM|nr:Na+/H+ antiporter NhaC family protein [Anoxybacter fermentans]AZR74695.1 sodium:proton antiporter [Anoxybacter fermentans]